MTLFGEEKDWKEFLCAPAQEILAELIERAKVHRCAYTQADDVKVAQLWAALTEVVRDLKELQLKVAKMEQAFKAIEALGDLEKRRALEEKVMDILKTKRENEKEQARKIVDVLMDF